MPEYAKITNGAIVYENYLLSVSFDEGTIIYWDANGDIQAYQILEFHWHSPSEHTINGSHFDAELHIRHFSYDTSDETLVLAILF